MDEIWFKKNANENGVCCIELKVVSDNEAAFGLYEKLFFKETKKYMCVDMEKSIKDIGLS